MVLKTPALVGVLYNGHAYNPWAAGGTPFEPPGAACDSLCAVISAAMLDPTLSFLLLLLPPAAAADAACVVITASVSCGIRCKTGSWLNISPGAASVRHCVVLSHLQASSKEAAAVLGGLESINQTVRPPQMPVVVFLTRVETHMVQCEQAHIL